MTIHNWTITIVVIVLIRCNFRCGDKAVTAENATHTFIRVLVAA